MSQPQNAPDFDLGPLIQLSNDFLISGDPGKRDANAFVLTLAAIFNDLKALMWFAEQHGKWKQPDGTVSAYNGQMVGMGGYILRTAIATIHELMDVLLASETELAHPD